MIVKSEYTHISRHCEQSEAIQNIRYAIQKSRHCGLDPQSPCSLQGIPHFVRNDGERCLQGIPASAGMTALLFV